MVCMTGTAMLLENIEAMGAEASKGFDKITETTNKGRDIHSSAGITNNVKSHPLLLE